MTFGGAYAVLPYVAQEAVEEHEWLDHRQMMAGLALAETTPGPLIMVLQFVGFVGSWQHPGTLSPIGAALVGSLLTTWVTFLPCFLFIFLGAPFVEKIHDQPQIGAALTAITAAVVGVILNLALWFAIHVLFREVETLSAGPLTIAAPKLLSLDPGAAALAALALVALFRFKVSVPALLAICGALGFAFRMAV